MALMCDPMRRGDCVIDRHTRRWLKASGERDVNESIEQVHQRDDKTFGPLITIST